LKCSYKLKEDLVILTKSMNSWNFHDWWPSYRH